MSLILQDRYLANSFGPDNDKLHNISQEQQTVDSFAKEIEQISYKLLQIHMIGKVDKDEATVREMNEATVVEAFKRGLKKEL